MNRLHLDWPELWEAAHRDEAQVVVAEPGHVIVAVPDRLLYGRGESSRRHLVSTGSLRAVVRLPATPTQGTDLHLVILEPPSNVSEVWFHDLRTGTGPRPDSVSKVTARLGSGVPPGGEEGDRCIRVSTAEVLQPGCSLDISWISP